MKHPPMIILPLVSRRQIETAIELLIEVLDRRDGDPDLEDTGDMEHNGDREDDGAIASSHWPGRWSYGVPGCLLGKPTTFTPIDRMLLAKNGQIGNGRSRSDPVRPTRKHGNSAEYLAARIKRDHPKILGQLQ